jgi:hypothetical protein
MDTETINNYVKLTQTYVLQNGKSSNVFLLGIAGRGVPGPTLLTTDCC